MLRERGGSCRLHGGRMAKSSPFEFLQQVRAEASKVTWPTRKETLVTTAMVFVMVVVGEPLLPAVGP